MARAPTKMWHHTTPTRMHTLKKKKKRNTGSHKGPVTNLSQWQRSYMSEVSVRPSNPLFSHNIGIHISWPGHMHKRGLGLPSKLVDCSNLWLTSKYKLLDWFTRLDPIDSTLTKNLVSELDSIVSICPVQDSFNLCMVHSNSSLAANQKNGTT